MVSFSRLLGRLTIDNAPNGHFYDEKSHEIKNKQSTLIPLVHLNILPTIFNQEYDFGQLYLDADATAYAQRL